MPGLSWSHRVELVAVATSIAMSREKVPGTRKPVLTPCDVAVLKALLDHQNAATGRCDPGHRRLAAKGDVGLSTVGRSMARLQAAGFLDWRKRPVLMPGIGVVTRHAYTIYPEPIRLRLAPEPKPPESNRFSLAAARARSIAWAKANPDVGDEKKAALSRPPEGRRPRAAWLNDAWPPPVLNSG